MREIREVYDKFGRVVKSVKLKNYVYNFIPPIIIIDTYAQDFLIKKTPEIKIYIDRKYPTKILKKYGLKIISKKIDGEIEYSLGYDWGSGERVISNFPPKHYLEIDTQNKLIRICGARAKSEWIELSPSSNKYF